MISDLPKVTCICNLTDRAWLNTVISSYEHQVYENKELVLVSYIDVTDVKREDIIIVRPEGDSAGANKNLALLHSNGDIIVNWEEKSSSHPDRIYKQLLGIAHSNAHLVMLSDIKINGSIWADRDRTDKVTNHGNAILETIAYIKYQELKYPNINIGLELSLLEQAHKLQLNSIAFQDTNYIQNIRIS